MIAKPSTLEVGVFDGHLYVIGLELGEDAGLGVERDILEDCPKDKGRTFDCSDGKLHVANTIMVSATAAGAAVSNRALAVARDANLVTMIVPFDSWAGSRLQAYGSCRGQVLRVRQGCGLALSSVTPEPAEHLVELA